MPNLIRIKANADTKNIYTEKIDGKDHIIVPSYTLPFDVVMNRGLYPRDQIEKAVTMINNTPAPLGHPRRNGEPVSASDPRSINDHYIGAYNRNARIDEDSGRVYVEKVIDVEFAQSRPKGKELIRRLNQHINGDNSEPIHTSIAVNTVQIKSKGPNYDWIADIRGVDHDAILLHEKGAATPDQGVGLLVNSDDAEKAVQFSEDDAKADSFLKRLFSSLSTNEQSKGEKMDKEQLQAMFDKQHESIGMLLKEFADKVLNREKERDEQVETVVNQLKDLTTDVKAVLTANEDQALAGKRADVAKHYKLSDEAVKVMAVNTLDEMHKNIGEVPSLAANSAGGGGADLYAQFSNQVE